MSKLPLSGNGWPAHMNPKEIEVIRYPIGDSGVKVRCARGAGPLLVAFATQFHDHIEPIDDSADDWGYCFRNVRGGTKLSNHASGTALDLNATRHPLGKAGTFSTVQTALIRALCHKFGIRWGGDYVGRKDEMHYEISVSPEKAAALIEKLGLVDQEG